VNTEQIAPYLELKPAPRGIFDLLDGRADRVRYRIPGAGPDGGERVVTYAEHAAEIRKVALWLHAQDLRQEERVAILAPNRVEWMTAAMALQSAGGALVPIYASSTSEQIGYVIDHSDAGIVFVDTPGLVASLAAAGDALKNVRAVVLMDDGLQAPEVPGKVWRWSEVLAAGTELEANGADFDALLDRVSLDQMGMMLYTSGSSGRPKGVPLTHRNSASNGADWMVCNGPALDEGVRDVLWLPMSHVFGFGEACIGNSLGWTSTMCAPQDALNVLAEVKPEVFFSVPAYWDKLASKADGDLDTLRALTGGNLRFCLSGGAGLKVEVKETFLSAGILILEGYGLTESSPTLTLNRPGDYRFDSVGKPLPSVELRLADDGEILARGPNVFAGYHKRDSSEVFTEDGWLMTGDLGRWTDDGFLQIIGRKKEILVTAGGKNVPPANIEVRFADDPAIAHAVVYGDGKKYLVAGFWRDPLGPVAEVDFDAHVAAAVENANGDLPKYMKVGRWSAMARPLTIEDGLLTPTLKLRRKAIYAAFGDDFEELYQ